MSLMNLFISWVIRSYNLESSGVLMTPDERDSYTREYSVHPAMYGKALHSPDTLCPCCLGCLDDRPSL